MKRNIKYFILKLKTKNGILVKDVQGSKMYLDLKDKGIATDLALDGIREPESTKMIQRILRKGDIVVDIGANIGYYAMMEACLVGKNGMVYAIEPSPSNLGSLKNNIKLNSYENIKTYEVGVGNKAGIAKMYISRYSNLNSLIHLKNRKIIDIINIRMTTLDRFLKNKKYPDLIRMDVEGYEYEIIKGMHKTLKLKKPLKLFIELHPHIMQKHQTIFVLKTLRDSSFEIIKVTRSFTVPEFKIRDKQDYDYSSHSIRDILEDDSIISGRKGAFEIFFERK